MMYYYYDNYQVNPVVRSIEVFNVKINANYCSTLCLCRLGYTVEKMPKSWFHLSEDMSRKFALSVASLWNIAVNVLKSLAEGNDWVLLLKVSALHCLYFLAIACCCDYDV